MVNIAGGVRYQPLLLINVCLSRPRFSVSVRLHSERANVYVSIWLLFKIGFSPLQCYAVANQQSRFVIKARWLVINSIRPVWVGPTFRLAFGSRSGASDLASNFTPFSVDFMTNFGQFRSISIPHFSSNSVNFRFIFWPILVGFFGAGDSPVFGSYFSRFYSDFWSTFDPFLNLILVDFTSIFNPFLVHFRSSFWGLVLIDFQPISSPFLVKFLGFILVDFTWIFSPFLVAIGRRCSRRISTSNTPKYPIESPSRNRYPFLVEFFFSSFFLSFFLSFFISFRDI